MEFLFIYFYIDKKNNQRSLFKYLVVLLIKFIDQNNNKEQCQFISRNQSLQFSLWETVTCQRFANDKNLIGNLNMFIFVL